MKWLKENWFLLALIALALCAIPGVILVILRLFEWDGEINRWLLNFNISYELRLSPWIALILLLLPIVLIILYFLKLKRKPIEVPSTFPWKKSIEDLHVNSLFQWLRNNVLLLLQLIVLLFLIYSVLGIRFHGATEISRHFILMIDNSASMSAKDVSPSRLDWAKQEALKEIDAVGDHDYGMVIVFNSKATTLQTYTNDKEKLREAVRSIAQTQRPTRIEEALALAESLANPVRSTEDAAAQPEDVPDDQKRTFVQARGISTVVHVYSDGRYAKLSETALAALSLRKADDDKSGGLNLRYHMAGKYEVDKAGDTNNLAVVDLNVMRKPMERKRGIPIPKLLTHVRRQLRRESGRQPNSTSTWMPTHASLDANVRSRRRKYTAARREGWVDEPGETSWPFELPFIDPSKNIVLRPSRQNRRRPAHDEAWLQSAPCSKVPSSAPPIGARRFLRSDGTKKIAA